MYTDKESDMQNEMTNRQRAILIVTKSIASFGYEGVGTDTFFGNPLTASDLENGLRAEVDNLRKLIAMSDDHYDSIGS
jgi:hypothetical protein